MMLSLERVKIPDKFKAGLDNLLTINGLKLGLKWIALISIFVAVGFPMYLAFQFTPIEEISNLREIIVHHNLRGTPDSFKVCIL